MQEQDDRVLLRAVVIVRHEHDVAGRLQRRNDPRCDRVSVDRLAAHDVVERVAGRIPAGDADRERSADGAGRPLDELDEVVQICRLDLVLERRLLRPCRGNRERDDHRPEETPHQNRAVKTALTLL